MIYVILLENILSNKNIAILQPISTVDGPTDGDFDDQRLSYETILTLILILMFY